MPRFVWALYTSISSDAASGVFFFNTALMVVSDSSMPNAALLFDSNNRNVQRLCPAGGFPQLNAMIFASISPVTFAGTGGVSRFFRFNTRSIPSSAYCLPTVYTKSVLQRQCSAISRCPAALTAFPCLSPLVQQEQNMSAPYLPRGVYSFAYDVLQPLLFFRC
jgi:hypothetical protein